MYIVNRLFMALLPLGAMSCGISAVVAFTTQSWWYAALLTVISVLCARDSVADFKKYRAGKSYRFVQQQIDTLIDRVLLDANAVMASSYTDQYDRIVIYKEGRKHFGVRFRWVVLFSVDDGFYTARWIGSKFPGMVSYHTEMIQEGEDPPMTNEKLSWKQIREQLELPDAARYVSEEELNQIESLLESIPITDWRAS